MWIFLHQEHGFLGIGNKHYLKRKKEKQRH
jgi:hypothetical protein